MLCELLHSIKQLRHQVLECKWSIRVKGRGYRRSLWGSNLSIVWCISAANSVLKLLVNVNCAISEMFVVRVKKLFVVSVSWLIIKY